MYSTCVILFVLIFSFIFAGLSPEYAMVNPNTTEFLIPAHIQYDKIDWVTAYVPRGLNCYVKKDHDHGNKIIISFV